MKNNEKKLLISTIILGIFMIIEFTGGILANSLALIADSAHMLSDFIATLFTLLSFKYSEKIADKKRSYGYQRFQILAAFINSITLFIISGYITYEAIGRFFKESDVSWEIMLPVSIIGIISNITILCILKSCSDKNLNITSAILHVIADLLGFIGALIAALIIKYTGWMIADPIVSIIISLLILYTAIKILLKSSHILLEGTPENLKYEELEKFITNLPNVINIHHFHSWSLTEKYILITVHITVKHNAKTHDIVVAAKKYMKNNLNISHATVEIEYESQNCTDVICDMD